MKTIYEVRFVCYQYNGGGSIRNGDQLIKEKFNTVEDAKVFADKVKSFLPRPSSTHVQFQEVNNSEGSNDFVSKYVWDGYVSKYLGIYRITEELVS